MGLWRVKQMPNNLERRYGQKDLHFIASSWRVAHRIPRHPPLPDDERIPLSNFTVE